MHVGSAISICSVATLSSTLSDLIFNGDIIPTIHSSKHSTMFASDTQI